MIDFELLNRQAKCLGIELNEQAPKRFDTYAEQLVFRNEHMNLTAITQPDEIVIKHFADSLSVLKYVNIRDGASVVDVGSGAGFPGIPLLIANPQIKLTIIDSLSKRIAFIEELLKSMQLKAGTAHMRAEDAGNDEDFREKFDFAVARAVAPLNVLCEYCLPLVKLGGLFVSMKGASADEEVKEAENAVEILGGKVIDTIHYRLENGDSRGLVLIKKISQTPTKYPRKPKKIDTKPL